ncbi:MAG: hypothetical protein AAB881_00665 [Patescibacteria group bacterium]
MKKLLILAAILAALWSVWTVSPVHRQARVKAELLARPRVVLVVQASDGEDRLLERAGLLQDNRVSLWTLREVFRETNPGLDPGKLHPGDRVKLPLAKN